MSAPISDHAAMQRVVVRMLLDPSFCDAVYAEPSRALADLSLSEASHRLLVAPDRRRYAADPHRRARTLASLLEEYAVSAAFLRAAEGDVRAADAFMSSPAMHATVQRRGSLAAAFGTWLTARASHPLVASVARLEAGIARCRRSHEQLLGAPTPRPPEGPLTPQTKVARAPGLIVVRGVAGALEVFSGVLAALRAPGASPLERLLDPGFALPPLAIAGDGTQRTAWTVEPGAGGEPAVSEAPDALAALLEAAGAPRTDGDSAAWPTIAALVAPLQAFDVPVVDLLEIVGDLRAEGTVRVAAG